ncbi:hypothetical protein ACSQ67_010453 [Phaseolus vulgaris]
MVSLSASQLKPRFFSSSSSSSSSSCGVKVWPWRGLDEWRESHLNENRKWGENGPEPQPLFRDSTQLGQASSLAELGSIVLSTSDPLAKSQLSHMAYSMWRRHNLPLGISIPPLSPPDLQIPNWFPSPSLFFICLPFFSDILQFISLKANIPNALISLYFSLLNP